MVNKLFEFMHEKHPGVQDMAVETFVKIARKCKRKFVTLQAQEPDPFINELLTNLPGIISDLQPHQSQTWYVCLPIFLSFSIPVFCALRLPALLTRGRGVRGVYMVHGSIATVCHR